MGADQKEELSEQIVLSCIGAQGVRLLVKVRLDDDKECSA
jgi:hypothetical protein